MNLRLEGEVFMILKRYDELKKGDKIWFHGHKAFVRNVKETGTVTDKITYITLVKGYLL